MRHLLFAAACAALATTAHGAVITVTTDSVLTGGPACTIRDAVTAANTDAATGGCAAGTFGVDTVQLPANALFAFTAPDNVDDFNGSNALPVVTGDLVLEGNGATLARTGACVGNNVQEPGEFRFLRASAPSLTVRDLTFRGGCADGFGGTGGALAGTALATLLERVVFEDNRTGLQGGAISLSSPPVPGVTGLTTLVDAYFVGNGALTGGAIYAIGTSLDVSRSTFANNTASSGAGGALSVFALGLPGVSGTVRVRNSTFSGNTAATTGGAIHVQENARLELMYSTVANNTAVSGAISGLGGPGFPPIILPSTPVVVLRGAWLSDNAGGNCVPQGLGTYAFTLEGANLSTDASCTGLTQSPPGELEALGDFGGLVPTRRPLPGSAGIDASPDCLLAGGFGAVTADQRGSIRPVDGDADGTASCDVGAVELNPGLAPVITAPAAATTLSDAPLVFGTSFGNAITLADADAGNANVRLEIAASSGVVTLATGAGLVFEQGDGTSDNMARFTGTLAAIGAALDGLAFVPDAGYTGPASLVLVANDLGNTGEGIPQSDTATVAITVAVRAAIANLAPASLAFGGRAVDAGPGPAQAVVLRNDGNVPLTGIAFKLAPSDYALAHDCGTTLAPGGDCTLSVTFDPVAGGSRLGVLAVLSNGTTSPNGVVLTGTGLADAVFADGFE